MTRTSDDDRRMIRLQEGDHAAFEEIVEEYETALIGFFFRNTRDRQLSEDLTQETLLRVFNQAWDYIPQGRFRAWMYRIGRNLLIDSVRRRSRDALVRAVKASPKEDEDDVLARMAADVLSPVQRARSRELAEIVDGLLRELPEEQRQTFVLHHYSGLTLSEVAEAMEAALPTVKSRLRLAREKLCEKLRGRGIRDPQKAAT